MVELTTEGRQHTEWMDTHRDRAAPALLGDVHPAQLAAFVEVADRLIRSTGLDDSTSVDPTRP